VKVEDDVEYSVVRYPKDAPFRTYRLQLDQWNSDRHVRMLVTQEFLDFGHQAVMQDIIDHMRSKLLGLPVYVNRISSETLAPMTFHKPWPRKIDELSNSGDHGR
jgi:hypothetical protein